MNIVQPIVVPEVKFQGWGCVNTRFPILARSKDRPEMIVTIIKAGNIYLFIGKDSVHDIKAINYSDSDSYMDEHVEFIRYYTKEDTLTITG